MTALGVGGLLVLAFLLIGVHAAVVLLFLGGRVRRIEAITEADRDLAAKMLRRALEKRTGKTVLPFDLEEDMRAAFGNVDPDTGEIIGGGT